MEKAVSVPPVRITASTLGCATNLRPSAPPEQGHETSRAGVAVGWRNHEMFEELNLRESQEILDDRAYLARLKDELTGQGFAVETQLAMGDPASELVKVAAELSFTLYTPPDYKEGQRVPAVLHQRHWSTLPLKSLSMSR